MNWHFLRHIGFDPCKIGLHHFSHWTNRDWEKRCDYCGLEMILDPATGFDWLKK